MNNLTNIFTKKNLEIMSMLQQQPLHIRDIAEKVHTSTGTAQSAVKLFEQQGFVSERKEKNRKIVSMNNSSPLLIKIKALVNTQQIIDSKNIKSLMSAGKVGIYGSFAQGTNDESSDIDLWIFADKEIKDLIESSRALEKELGRKVNLLALNKKKLNELKNNDSEFYIRLKLTSTLLNGDIFD